MKKRIFAVLIIILIAAAGVFAGCELEAAGAEGGRSAQGTTALTLLEDSVCLPDCSEITHAHNSCGAAGCTLIEAHYHGNCRVEGCTLIEAHNHSYCGAADCTLTGVHAHGGCGVNGCSERGTHKHGGHHGGSHH